MQYITTTAPTLDVFSMMATIVGFPLFLATMYMYGQYQHGKYCLDLFSKVKPLYKETPKIERTKAYYGRYYIEGFYDGDDEDDEDDEFEDDEDEDKKQEPAINNSTIINRYMH